MLLRQRHQFLNIRPCESTLGSSKKFESIPILGKVRGGQNDGTVAEQGSATKIIHGGRTRNACVFDEHPLDALCPTTKGIGQPRAVFAWIVANTNSNDIIIITSRRLEHGRKGVSEAMRRQWCQGCCSGILLNGTRNLGETSNASMVHEFASDVTAICQFIQGSQGNPQGWRSVAIVAFGGAKERIECLCHVICRFESSGASFTAARNRDLKA